MENRDKRKRSDNDVEDLTDSGEKRTRVDEQDHEDDGRYDKSDFDALVWACEHGNIRVVRFLLQNPRLRPSDDHNIALNMACHKNHCNIIKLLLQDPRVNVEGMPHVIDGLLRDGRLDALKILVNDPRYDPSAHKNHLIRELAKYGHLNLIKFVLKDPRVDPGAKNGEALNNACKKGHLKVVDLLLRHPKVDPSVGESRCLILATENNHLEVVKRLLRDPRTLIDGDDREAVSDAFQRKQMDIFDTLISDLRYYTDFYEQPRPGPFSWHNSLRMTVVNASIDILEARARRAMATQFCFKTIGNGWADLQEPVLHRFGGLHWKIN